MFRASPLLFRRKEKSAIPTEYRRPHQSPSASLAIQSAGQKSRCEAGEMPDPYGLPVFTFVQERFAQLQLSFECELFTPNVELTIQLSGYYLQNYALDET